MLASENRCQAASMKPPGVLIGYRTAGFASHRRWATEHHVALSRDMTLLRRVCAQRATEHHVALSRDMTLLRTANTPFSGTPQHRKTTNICARRKYCFSVLGVPLGGRRLRGHCVAPLRCESPSPVPPHGGKPHPPHSGSHPFIAPFRRAAR